MRMNWEDVKETKALVTETLSNTELVKLFYDLRDIEHGYPALPEGTYGGSVIGNVIYESWDGERHEGCLVSIMMPGRLGKNDEYYFMERTWTMVGETAKTYLAKPTYHRLMPVTVGGRNKIEEQGKPGSMALLVNHIINAVYEDSFIYDDKETFLNSYSEAMATRSFDKTPAEIAKYESNQKNLFHEIVEGNVPAGDERWDNLLFGDREFRAKVFNQLRKNGHSVGLDGEKDSFGWVTCGIVMDGELMTSDYF